MLLISPCLGLHSLFNGDIITNIWFHFFNHFHYHFQQQENFCRKTVCVASDSQTFSHLNPVNEQ